MYQHCQSVKLQRGARVCLQWQPSKQGNAQMQISNKAMIPFLKILKNAWHISARIIWCWSIGLQTRNKTREGKGRGSSPNLPAFIPIQFRLREIKSAWRLRWNCHPASSRAVQGPLSCHEVVPPWYLGGRSGTGVVFPGSGQSRARQGHFAPRVTVASHLSTQPSEYQGLGASAEGPLSAHLLSKPPGSTPFFWSFATALWCPASTSEKGGAEGQRAACVHCQRHAPKPASCWHAMLQVSSTRILRGN